MRRDELSKDGNISARMHPPIRPLFPQTAEYHRPDGERSNQVGILASVMVGPRSQPEQHLSAVNPSQTIRLVPVG